MSGKIILKNGRILDPSCGRDELGSLFIDQGVVVEPFLEGDADSVVEVGPDCWICPGFIDSMVHLCEPGMTSRETVETGTTAAAAGGFTGLVNMPGNQPATDEVHRLIWIQQRAADRAVVTVHQTATVSRGMEGKLLAPIGSLHRAGAVALTDHQCSLQDNELMRRALEYASMFDIPILDHCRDESLSPGGLMHEGYWSVLLGLRGWPAIAEEMMVARNVLMAEMTRARLHCLRITTEGSIRLIREAKERQVTVTAGATPHHLLLDDSSLSGYQTIYKVDPPLRSEKDVAALRRAVKDGVVDFLCSDHAPTCGYEKEVEFDDAPFGAPGLETAVGATLTALVHGEGVSPLAFCALWSTRVSDYFRLGRGSLQLGRPADVTVVNPRLEWIVDPSRFVGKSKMSPFAGRSFKGRAICTLVQGRVVWQDMNHQ
ncbi:MAG: dihydroorotase [Candidatus Methylacidiphilales bacterium]